MKILALDSSAEICTAALCDNDRLVCEITLNTGHTHSQTLLPCIEQLLRLTETSINGIDLLACTVGPGSFTGVRIGVATVKGLAFENNIPCIGISSLDSLARNLSCNNGILCPVMDARREHVYNALYRCSNGKITRLCADRLIAIEELDREFENTEEKIYMSGDAYGICMQSFTHTQIQPTSAGMCHSRGYSVALCALDKFNTDGAVDHFRLSPVYLRPSQAERERNEKMKG